MVLSGDIMHTALQCAEPQLNSCFCTDAQAARATRRRLLETFADCRSRQPARDAPGRGPREAAAAKRLAVESSNTRTEHR